MKILKTSALAAVLALGSLSANATSYNGSDSFDLVINSSAHIAVEFRDATMTFDNVIPNDALTGSIDLGISGDSGNDMTCELNSVAISSDTAATIAIYYDPDDNAETNNDRLGATLEFSLTDCAQAETDQTLSVTGTVGGEVEAGTSFSESIELVVSYGATTTITGQNT